MVYWCERCCPKCDKSNWVDNGDPRDLTAYEPEALKCWNCGHEFFIDEEMAEIMNLNIERADVIDGLRTPVST